MKPVSTEHFTVQETPPFGGLTLRIILASHPGILIGPYATPDPRDPTNPRDILGPVLQNWIVNLFDHVPAGFHGTLQILQADVSFPRGDQLPSLRCQSVSLVPTIFSSFSSTFSLYISMALSWCFLISKLWRIWLVAIWLSSSLLKFAFRFLSYSSTSGRDMKVSVKSGKE